MAMKKAEGAGSSCERIGESGEHGCYQYMPATWAAASNEVLGYVVKQTIVNEEYVTAQRVAKWIDKGMNVSSIALAWNAGGASSCSSGVNSKGVKYDSCAHVAKVLAYYKSN
jgi:hypothetical protein